MLVLSSGEKFKSCRHTFLKHPCMIVHISFIVCTNVCLQYWYK